MKKLILSVCIVASLLMASVSNAQSTKYYYYPQTNVYYDPGHSQYIYLDNGTWTTVRTLPPRVSIRNVPRVTVYSDKPEVWRMNEQHKVKYQHYPNGKAVGYKGTNANKANGKTRHK